LPESLQFKLPASTADVGASIGATLSVGRAIKDPSVENIANAYAGIDELAFQAANKGLLDIAIKADSTVLPECWQHRKRRYNNRRCKSIRRGY
jgi:hypothetical protein